MEFIRICVEDKAAIEKLSALASTIVKQHFDPLIGAEQNDYMISKFQSVHAITEQLMQEYRYYFVRHDQETVGFLAFYPKERKMYLSKFYVDAAHRGKGVSTEMFRFIKRETMKENLQSIFLNVNRGNVDVIHIYEHLGFCMVGEEKNDIGEGYIMDDLVLEYRL